MQINSVSTLGMVESKNNSQSLNKNVNFGELLQKELDKVNELQLNAEESTQSLLTGEVTDIHEVMISTEEARLALELAVQIRNKIVDAYQEISRMQI